MVMITVELPPFRHTVDILYIAEPMQPEMNLYLDGDFYGPVEVKQGLKSLVSMVMQKRDDIPREQLENYLMMLHFAYMERGYNATGMAYPLNEFDEKQPFYNKREN